MGHDWNKSDILHPCWDIQVIEPKQKVSAFIHMIAKMETIYQLPDGSGVLSDWIYRSSFLIGYKAGQVTIIIMNKFGKLFHFFLWQSIKNLGLRFRAKKLIAKRDHAKENSYMNHNSRPPMKERGMLSHLSTFLNTLFLDLGLGASFLNLKNWNSMSVYILVY